MNKAWSYAIIHYESFYHTTSDTKLDFHSLSLPRNKLHNRPGQKVFSPQLDLKNQE